MSLNLLRQPLSSTTTFRHIFPFKLKYLGLTSKLGFQPTHKFSTRPYKSRPRDVGPKAAPPLSKSLIEDEDELSDWVSGLRTSSMKSGVFTDDEEGFERGKRKRRGKFVNEGGSDGEEREFREMGVKNFHGSSGFGGDNRRRFEGENVRGGVRGRGREFGVRGGRGGRGGRGDRGGGRFGEERGYGVRDGFKGKEREFGGNGRGGRGGGRGGGSRGRVAYVSKEEEDDEFGLRNEKGKEKAVSGFLDLSDEDDGSEVDTNVEDDDDDVEEVVRSRSSMFRNEGDRGSGRFGRERGFGVRGGVKEKEREFGVRNRMVGHEASRGGGSRGRVEDVSEEEDDELDGFEARNEKGEGKEKEKSVSEFLGLIGEDDDSEQDMGVEDDDGEGGVRSRGSLFGNEGGNLRTGASSSRGCDSYLSDTRFDQCSISPSSLKAIRDAGYEKMTVVQEATLPVILKGKDVMAKAKTGTGKTVAFLLPSIEVVINTPPADRDDKRPPILVLVICPTRELANQAAAEANTLLKYHPSIGVQVVIGGTRLAVEQKRMQANPCQILVATPGRLRDHLENTAGFATRIKGVKVLVLDEADHLLDMGFRKDIEKIIAAVSKQRQTLLFSATVPDEVRQMSHIALRRDHEYINTVEEGSEETHARVRQMHLVAPLENQFYLLYTILKEHISDDVNYKVLVFCTTAMVTKLVADLLGELNLNVREIHSRKSQTYRTRVSDEFRKSKGLILVTSDVSARGVDYPDVTLVIQLGLPSDREQYIHRLGRTGRKGKEGQGILLLAPWEESFLKSVKDLPITKATPPIVDPDVKKKVERALSNVEMKSKESAYQAWLGYYNSDKNVGRDKFRLVELANEFSRSMGLDTPPAIPKLVLGKMGLKNVPGLRTK